MCVQSNTFKVKFCSGVQCNIAAIGSKLTNQNIIRYFLDKFSRDVDSKPPYFETVPLATLPCIQISLVS